MGFHCLAAMRRVYKKGLKRRLRNSVPDRWGGEATSTIEVRYDEPSPVALPELATNGLQVPRGNTVSPLSSGLQEATTSWCAATRIRSGCCPWYGCSSRGQPGGCLRDAVGFGDPAVSTTAISLLCQSLGLGSHLLLTACLSECHIPGEDEWIDLLWRLLTAVAPPPPSPH